MPRKIKSDGESTQQRKTSQKRAMEAKGPSGRTGKDTLVQDGGKWAGSGRKTVEHSEGPSIVRQAQPGRGPKAHTAMRTMKANHPNRG
jgi:hypothetical protein